MVKKALVAIVVEKSLLDVGKPIYDKVVSSLQKYYQCDLPDCYEHPEYLDKILKELFGDSHKVIVDSIQMELKEFAHQEPIARFLQAITK